MKKVEKSCGVILVLRKENEEDRFLILHQNNETKSWSFPKGHMEENETPKETVLRELREETGITDIEFADLPSVIEEYDFSRRGEVRHKINELFIAFTKDDKVIIQEDEIIEYKWATYKEALNIFTYEDQKKELEIIKKYIDQEGISKRLITLNPLNISNQQMKKFPQRYVVRVLLVNEDRLVLINSKDYDERTFPGGGIDGGETIFNAVTRECKEETGYNVEILKELGHVYLVRKDYISISFGFIARVIGEKGQISLTEAEIFAGYLTEEFLLKEVFKYVNNNNKFLEERPLIFLKEAEKYLENILK